MTDLVVREDPIEITGSVVSVIPPPVLAATRPSGSEPRSLWTVVVKPEPQHHDRLTTRNGVTNIDGYIECTVAVDERLVGRFELLFLLSNTFNRRVHIAGTWCDDDDTSRTAIYPLGILAAEYDIEVYDISGWPVAVRDLDLFAFAHARDTLAAIAEPHAGESRNLIAHIPGLKRPSDAAVPFVRAYAPNRIDHAEAVTLSPVDGGGTVDLAATIETGAPSDGKGFFFAQVALTFDEPDLDNFCPPGTCDLDGKHCAHHGLFRFTWVPPHVPYAQTGNLALSPGDGKGFISGIVANLSPVQVYDHMGIFVDNGRTIRHCTSSQDRLEDEDLFTAEISIKLAGVFELDHAKIPLNGLRPDLVRFGWPGSITQTVEEVYRTGRNSLNSEWSYASTHPGQDVDDPERPGVPFRIYHLPRAERKRRLEFNDPERDKSESVTRLQESSVWVGNPLREFKPMLVRPHPQFEAQAAPALRLVADQAKKIRAHYRFVAYTNGSIGLDPAFIAPPRNDSSWGALAPGARWAAGTIPGMCSSFIWTAVQLANKKAPPAGLPEIVLEDRSEAPDPNRGLEYGASDGQYQYHAEERKKTGTTLVAKIGKKIRDGIDDKVPDAAYALAPALSLYRDVTADRVSNQMANAFATDKCERVDDAWSTNSEGETVSPDDVLNFWDLKPHNGVLSQPEGKIAIYGDAVPIQLTAPKWLPVPLFRKQDFNLGIGEVSAVAIVRGAQIAGATVRFDLGCATLMTTDNRESPPLVNMGAGTHFADAFIVLQNPASGNLETFRTPRPVEFEVQRGQVTPLALHLEPPSDLWRIIDIHLDADIHDRSFWGGDADHREFHIDRGFELRQDLDDDPQAPTDQQNSVLHHEEVWRTEPQVGSGVHVAFAVKADLHTVDRSVQTHCRIALIDTDSGGYLGLETSSADQLESRDNVIPADQSVDVLSNVAFASDEVVPERATVSLRLTNRRRPS